MYKQLIFLQKAFMNCEELREKYAWKLIFQNGNLSPKPENRLL